MEIIKLKTRQRSGTGKSYTHKARVQGWVPAIYYGHNRQSVPIEIDAHEFSTLVRHRKTTHLIDLGLDNSQDESIAVIKEIQRHVIKSNEFVHIDFQHVAMNEKVSVHIPLELVGIPIGVKENHGILDHPTKSVIIECFPMDIPEKISVDVSKLNIGDSIHVRDVTFANLTIKEAADEVLAVVTHPTREITPEGTAPEAAATPAAAPAATATKAAATKAAAPSKGKK